MTTIESSSTVTTAEEKKPDSFVNAWQYAKELSEENSRLKKRLALLEHEINLLLPAAFFIRSRDALHRALAKYATLADACRQYRKHPSSEKTRNILAALRAIETEEK